VELIKNFRQNATKDRPLVFLCHISVAINEMKTDDRFGHLVAHLMMPASDESNFPLLFDICDHYASQKDLTSIAHS
jgi:hypothetical protein